MGTTSLMKARQAVDAHRYRTHAARELGISPHQLRSLVGSTHSGNALDTSYAVAMHRLGLPLEQVGQFCGLSIRKVVAAIQAAEKSEIQRIQFVAEGAAWRAYTASLASHQTEA
jgi:hypothetical protein